MFVHEEDIQIISDSFFLLISRIQLYYYSETEEND